MEIILWVFFTVKQAMFLTQRVQHYRIIRQKPPIVLAPMLPHLVDILNDNFELTSENYKKQFSLFY